MKRLTTSFALFVTIGLTGACAENNRAAEDEFGRPDAGTMSSARVGDQHNFVREMLAGGQADVELGRLAQERSQNSAVREFGEMMVRDHTNANEQLRRMAGDMGSTGAPADVAMSADHRQLKETLSDLSGETFDRQYMTAMVNEHEKVIRKVEEKAQNADDQQVKNWAEGTLPTLKQHLERARQIRQSLGG